MPLTTVSENLRELLKRPDVKKLIKDEYITERLFVDSAIRSRLRGMGVKGVGKDEIVPHLERLKASKARHISQQGLIHKLKNHKRRIIRTKVRLNDLPKDT